MKKGPGGSVVSSFFNVTDMPTEKDVYDKGMKIYEGQILRIHYVDDATNLSKQYTEYDVLVREAQGGSTELKNCRYIGDMSAANDQQEIILEPSSFAFSGVLGRANFPENQNGSMVLVGFIDGSYDKPVILGGTKHFRNTKAVRADGIRLTKKFRGVQFDINNAGELIITYTGGQQDNGDPARPDTAPTIVKIDQQGRLSITDNESQEILMDRVDKSINITTKENYNITVGKDRVEDIAENRTTNIGTNDTTAVGANQATTIGGSEDVTTSGDYNHTAANMNFISSGDIKIGSAGASENLVLGVAFQTLYNNHAHIGNLGILTGTPVQPMTAAELSQRNFTE